MSQHPADRGGPPETVAAVTVQQLGLLDDVRNASGAATRGPSPDQEENQEKAPRTAIVAQGSATELQAKLVRFLLPGRQVRRCNVEGILLVVFVFTELDF